MPFVGDERTNTVTFPDPAELASLPVDDVLRAAARGHIGIDARFIRSIVDRGEDAAPALLRFGLEDHENDRVDLEEDLIAIFRHLRTPEALPFYIECIRRAPDDVPDDVVEGILQHRDRAVEPLLALYDEMGEEQGSDVAFILASLRVRDERILELLFERLEYDTADGAFCLGLYGDPAAKPRLEKLLSEIPEEDAELRREIRFAIEQIDEQQTAAEPELEPFDIFDQYPDEASPPVEVLPEAERMEMLEAPSAALRIEAADSFRNKTLSSEARARLLEHARSDPNPKVRGRCWEALSDAAETKSVAAEMWSVVADTERDVEERTGAMIALATQPLTPDLDRYIQEFYADPGTRARALEAMWRSFDRRYAEYFPRHLNDPDPEVKRSAIWGVGYMGLGSYAGSLRSLMEDDEFRPDALFAYALSVPAEMSRGRVRALFRKIDDAAGGLSQGEANLVQVALDERLAMHGLEPVFSAEREVDWTEEDEPKSAGLEPQPAGSKVGRNDPCPCGSGKKYKKCHGA
jgi:HEAT repeat protein